MSKKKYFVSFILVSFIACMLIFALAACGQKTPPADEKTAEKLEVTNDKVKALHEADALTVTADSTTIKASTGGVTVTRGGSGLKKTLDDMLTAIQALTVTTPHGPSSTPINSAKFASIQADLPNYLEG